MRIARTRSQLARTDRARTSRPRLRRRPALRARTSRRGRRHSPFARERHRGVQARRERTLEVRVDASRCAGLRTTSWVERDAVEVKQRDAGPAGPCFSTRSASRTSRASPAAARGHRSCTGPRSSTRHTSPSWRIGAAQAVEPRESATRPNSPSMFSDTSHRQRAIAERRERASQLRSSLLFSNPPRTSGPRGVARARRAAPSGLRVIGGGRSRRAPPSTSRPGSVAECRARRLGSCRRSRPRPRQRDEQHGDPGSARAGS